MRIGICTLQIARNYGAVLQAYALKTYLETLGHSVYMLNTAISQSNVSMPKSFWKSSIKEKVLYPRYFFRWYLPHALPMYLRERHFDRFREHYLDTDLQETYDLIIYGSDQIWSKWKNGFNPFFWGVEHTNTKRKIAFSASMGVLDIKNDDESFIKNALSDFSAISVREKDLQCELNNRHLVTHLYVEQTLDPVFLLNKSRWEGFAPQRIISEPYLLFYDFQIDDETTHIVNSIAQQKNIKIVRITDGIVSDGFDKYYCRSAGPLEFLSLMKYADFVFSSSFHGTAFSILFEKQFYVRQMFNCSRVKSLLEMCGCENRFVNSLTEVDLNQLIDYTKLNTKLYTNIHKTKLYLESALKE